MKKAFISLATFCLVAGQGAFAAGQLVKHVEFNTATNSYTVEFDGGGVQQFEAKTLVLKLDVATQKPFLEKGMHMYYLNFPNFEVMNSISADVAH